jgi:hypothetical protein
MWQITFSMMMSKAEPESSWSMSPARTLNCAATQVEELCEIDMDA